MPLRWYTLFASSLLSTIHSWEYTALMGRVAAFLAKTPLQKWQSLFPPNPFVAWKFLIVHPYFCCIVYWVAKSRISTWPISIPTPHCTGHKSYLSIYEPSLFFLLHLQHMLLHGSWASSYFDSCVKTLFAATHHQPPLTVDQSNWKRMSGVRIGRL